MKKQLLTLVFLSGIVLASSAQNKKETQFSDAVGGTTKSDHLQSDENDSVLLRLYGIDGPYSGFNPADEIIEKRTENTKIFKINDGKEVAMIGAGPTHYLENGAYKTSWNGLELCNSRPGYILANTHNKLKTYYGINGVSVRKSLESNNEIIYRRGNIKWLDSDLNPLAKIDDYNMVAPQIKPEPFQVEPNKAYYPQISPGISYEVEQLAGKLKTQYIIDSSQYVTTHPAGSAYLAFTEQFDFPYEINLGRDEKTPGALVFENNEGEGIWVNEFYIKAGNGQRKEYSAIYKMIGKSSVQLTYLIPIAFFSDTNFTYPLYVDPTVLFTPTASIANTGTTNEDADAASTDVIVVGFYDCSACDNEQWHPWAKFNLSALANDNCISYAELLLFQDNWTNGNGNNGLRFDIGFMNTDPPASTWAQCRNAIQGMTERYFRWDAWATPAACSGCAGGADYYEGAANSWYHFRLNESQLLKNRLSSNGTTQDYVAIGLDQLNGDFDVCCGNETNELYFRGWSSAQRPQLMVVYESFTANAGVDQTITCGSSATITASVTGTVPNTIAATTNVNLVIWYGSSYSSENSWSLVRNRDGATIVSGGSCNCNNTFRYNGNVALEPGGYTLRLRDSYGDGWNGGGYFNFNGSGNQAVTGYGIDYSVIVLPTTSTAFTPSYTWDNGLGSGASKTVTPAVTTDYTVTITANGCSRTDVVRVNVNPPTGSTLTNYINDAGTIACGGSYTSTLNTTCYGDEWWGTTGNDIYYRFTVGGSNNTVVNLSHCGSVVADTYMGLLASNGTLITTHDDYGPLCSGSMNASMQPTLAPGTYFVVSEGYGVNGSVTTTISIVAPSGGSMTTGTATVCANATGVAYAVTGSSSPYTTRYDWTVPSGTVATGQGTSSITVNFGATGGNVNCTPYNGDCAGTAINYGVTVNSASSAGSWANTLYNCQTTTGNLYTSGGMLTSPSITGNNGSTITWYYGTGNPATNLWAANNSTIAPGACCFTGALNSVSVYVQNGVCPAATINQIFATIAPVAPTGGSVSPTSGCASVGNITLTYSGGNTGQVTGGSYQWFSGSCGGTSVGAGQSLVIAAPASTTNYFVRTTDICGDVSGCYGPITYTISPNVTAGTVSGTTPICIGATPTYTSSGTAGGSWSSTVPGVATVIAGTGVVTAVSAGTSNITYTVSSGCGSPLSAFQTITVNPNVTAGTVSGTTPICIGATTTYTSNGTAGGTWSSGTPANATVNSTTGAVLGVAAGSSLITYTVSSGCGSPTSATQSVMVNGPTSGTTTWTGNIDSDWRKPGNWTDCVPGSGSHVIIPAAPVGGNLPVITIGVTGDCLDIDVQSTTSDLLEIQTGGFLNVHQP